MKECMLDVATTGALESRASYVRLRDAHGREIWAGERIPHPATDDALATLDFERKLALAFWIMMGTHDGPIRIPKGAYLQAYLLID